MASSLNLSLSNILLLVGCLLFVSEFGSGSWEGTLATNKVLIKRANQL